MGLSVTFISGLRRAGKSAVIRLMVDRLWKRPPHYLRLVQRGSDKQQPKPMVKAPHECGVSTARWVDYDGERIFEVLPEALSEIHKKDRFGSVVIEADADPTLRHAYPYDHRVFGMPLPQSVHEVFRDSSRAADELQRVLDDTAAFASEFFGLLTHPDDGDPPEERADLTGTQMRTFLYSPLGDELATRVQLQSSYHGLVESDVIVVNNQAGKSGPQSADCVRRIERLLEHVRGACGRRGELFLCNPCEGDGREAKKLLEALAPMCKGGK